MKITEKILNIVKKKPISRKELIEKLKLLNISENRIDTTIHKLYKKEMIVKINDNYIYVNPFSKTLKIENIKDREIEIYKIFIRLISPHAKWKQLQLLREAYHSINNNEVKK